MPTWRPVAVPRRRRRRGTGARLPRLPGRCGGAALALPLGGATAGFKGQGHALGVLARAPGVTRGGYPRDGGAGYSRAGCQVMVGDWDMVNGWWNWWCLVVDGSWRIQN